MSDTLDTAYGFIPIEQYLRGCVGFEVADEAIATILVDRKVSWGDDVQLIDQRTRDLCKADLYMWCASSPSTRKTVEDADGGWKHREGGEQSSAFDKRNLRLMANDIYAMYDERVRTSKVQIYSFGIKPKRHNYD